MKRIITLTTDFGLNDHYVGVMKGVILGINAEAQIVDITHNIPRHNIFNAAYVIRNSYRYFPQNTVHVVVVDPGVGSERKPIVVRCDRGIFIGPDNGVFTFILEENNEAEIMEITNSEYMLKELSSTFHGRDIFAPVAAHLSLGADSAELGSTVDAPVMLEINKPEVHDDEITGEVIYEDSFGNLVTNIPGGLITRDSKILVDNHIIDTVASSYSDVGKGGILAVIGSSGFLEISVNQGSASLMVKDRIVKVIK